MLHACLERAVSNLDRIPILHQSHTTSYKTATTYKQAVLPNWNRIKDTQCGDLRIVSKRLLGNHRIGTVWFSGRTPSQSDLRIPTQFSCVELLIALISDEGGEDDAEVKSPFFSPAGFGCLFHWDSTFKAWYRPREKRIISPKIPIHDKVRLE